jgi:type VI secretion system VasD/TssJ family lipoprotein
MLRRRLLLSFHAAALGALGVPWRLARAQAQVQPAGPRRLALLVGNARYPDVPLNNPVNDARLMADTLRALGFEVTMGTDLRRADFLQALLQFAKQIPPGADVLFYYAGHAVQIRGSNYLLPVDIQNLGDPDWVEQNAINLDGSVIRQLLQREGAGVRLLFIDACRDNPFATGAQRVAALTAGLASVQSSVNIDGGVLIASASLPNKPAEDGPPGGNGVFTAHLAREMRVAGQNVETMLKKVAVQVDRETKQAQLPMFASSLTTEFFFNTGKPAAGAATVQIVQPARSVSISVRADPALNSDSKRQPRKSVLWVYVLRSTAAFQKAGFDALYERAEATLGPELLGREKLNLSPGESYTLPLDLASTARAIGVLVAYREPDGEGWKALLPLAAAPAGAAPLPLRIDAGARSVSIALAG